MGTKGKKKRTKTIRKQDRNLRRSSAYKALATSPMAATSFVGSGHVNPEAVISEIQRASARGKKRTTKTFGARGWPFTISNGHGHHEEDSHPRWGHATARPFVATSYEEWQCSECGHINPASAMTCQAKKAGRWGSTEECGTPQLRAAVTDMNEGKKLVGLAMTEPLPKPKVVAPPPRPKPVVAPMAVVGPVFSTAYTSPRQRCQFCGESYLASRRNCPRCGRRRPLQS